MAAGKLGEVPADLDEFVEGTALDDAARFKHQNAVGVPDGGESVRDYEGRAAFHDFGECRLNSRLGKSVERARSLIEDEDWRILEQRPRDRQALALATGE